MSITLNQKNPDWIRQLTMRMNEQDKLEIAVCFPLVSPGVGVPHYPTGASIIDVAIWNEFGTSGGLPPRPFMQKATPDLQSNFKRQLQAAQPRINSGQLDARTAYEAVSVESEGIMKGSIDSGGFAPNAPETIKRKGSAQPLIDTGAMRNHVTSKVRNR